MAKLSPGIKSFHKDRYTLSVTEIIPGQYERFSNKMNYLQPHRRNYFVFFLVTSGHIRHSIDFQSILTGKGSIFFTTPDQVYFVEGAKDLGGIGVSFSDENLSKKEYDLPVIQNLLHKNQCRLNKFEYDSIFEILKKMFNEFSNKLSYSQLMLESYLSGFLILMSRAYSRNTDYPSNHESSDTVIVKFKSHLTKSWNKSLTVSDYAELMNVSAGHLNFLIKKFTGKKTIDWILEKKLVEAKRLLLHTEKSVKEIAFELGFDDPGYFNRFFKKYSHITPLAFRMEIREKYNGLNESSYTSNL